NLNGAFGRFARSRSLRNRFAARRIQILKRAPFVSATADFAYAIARRTNADFFSRIALKRFFGRPPRGVDRGVSSLRFAFSVLRYARTPRRPASDNAFDVVAPIRFDVFFGVFMADLPAQILARGGMRRRKRRSFRGTPPPVVLHNYRIASQFESSRIDYVSNLFLSITESSVL